MAFSFNWAGLNVPTIDYFDAVKDKEFGANLGKAARGYEDRSAAKDYAEKIRTYRMGQNAAKNTDAARIAEIKQQIAELKQQNAAIEAQTQPVQVQPNPAEEIITHPSSEQLAEEMFAVNFDPSNASMDDILEMQRRVGTTADGVWGPKSRAAFDTKYGYLFQ